MYYPNGHAGVSINGMDLSQFCAKLATRYSVSGAELNNSVYQGRNRSDFTLLGRTVGLKTIRLPIEFEAETKTETQQAIVRFNGQCTGSTHFKRPEFGLGTELQRMGISKYNDTDLVELDIGDGYIYKCVCNEMGSQSWSNDEHCSIDYVFVGIAQGEQKSLNIADGATYPHCIGTYPKNDCRIEFKIPVSKISTHWTKEGIWVKASLSECVAIGENSIVMRNEYWSAAVHIAYSATMTSRTVSYDGIEKKMRLSGNTPAPGVLDWGDYPYLRPGYSALRFSLCADKEIGAYSAWTSMSSDGMDAVVNWIPSFV